MIEILKLSDKDSGEWQRFQDFTAAATKPRDLEFKFDNKKGL